jgi:hypothetical protein
MHTVIHLLGFWAVAFVTLGAALVLLNIFYDLIGFDLGLHNLGKECVIAAMASVVEGASVWTILTFVPMAGRALIVPALIVGIIYKISHLEDWSRYEIMALLLFQFTIGCFCASLLLGHFQTAIIILAVFLGILAIIAAIARSFG